MKNLIILFVIFIANTVYAQQWENKAIKRYYKFINQAELNIADGNYKNASDLYDSAWNTTYVFPVDLYNAFRLSFNANDTTKSLDLYRRMVELGINKERFSLGFNHVSDSVPTFYKYIESHYDTFRAKTKFIDIYQFYSAFLDEMYLLDQQARQLGRDSLMRVNDSLLEVKFLDFAANSGFPDFIYAGYMEKIRTQPYSPGTLDLIMFHRRGAPNSFFLDVIHKNMLDGKVDARTYMLRYFCNPCEGEDYRINIPIEPITQAQLELTDSLRKEILLEPLQDYYKKLVYHRNHRSNLEFVLVNEYCRLFNGDNELQIKAGTDSK